MLPFFLIRRSARAEQTQGEGGKKSGQHFDASAFFFSFLFSFFPFLLLLQRLRRLHVYDTQEKRWIEKCGPCRLRRDWMSTLMRLSTRALFCYLYERPSPTRRKHSEQRLWRPADGELKIIPSPNWVSGIETAISPGTIVPLSGLHKRKVRYGQLLFSTRLSVSIGETGCVRVRSLEDGMSFVSLTGQLRIRAYCLNMWIYCAAATVFTQVVYDIGTVESKCIFI